MVKILAIILIIFSVSFAAESKDDSTANKKSEKTTEVQAKPLSKSLRVPAPKPTNWSSIKDLFM